MKKTALIITILLVLSMLLLPLTAMAEGGLITRIRLPKSQTMTIAAGQSIGQILQLAPEVTPAEPVNPALFWSSSDPSIAEVNQAGQVISKSFGSCTVYAKAADGSGVSAKCKIYVKQFKAKAVVIAQPAQTLTAGDVFQLSAEVGPAEAYDKTVSWSSSNKKVATVDENGVVTAVKRGKAYIYARANGGGSKTRARVRITVVSAPKSPAEPTPVKTDPSNSDGVNYSGNVYDLYTQLGAGEEEAVRAYINTLGKSRGERIVKTAMKYIGTPYEDLDCSTFTRTVYAKYKYKIGRLSDVQAKNCRKYEIAKADIRPGDLVFFRENDGVKCKCSTASCWRYRQIHHVGIYIGDINGMGYIVDASSVVGKIVVRRWNYGDSFAEMTYVTAAHRAR